MTLHCPTGHDPGPRCDAVHDDARRQRDELPGHFGAVVAEQGEALPDKVLSRATDLFVRFVVK